MCTVICMCLLHETAGIFKKFEKKNNKTSQTPVIYQIITIKSSLWWDGFHMRVVSKIINFNLTMHKVDGVSTAYADIVRVFFPCTGFYEDAVHKTLQLFII